MQVLFPDPWAIRPLPVCLIFSQIRHPASCQPSSGYKLLIASAFGNSCQDVSMAPSVSCSCRRSLPELPLPRSGPRRCRSPPPSPGHVDAALLHTAKRIGYVGCRFALNKSAIIPALRRESSTSWVYVEGWFSLLLSFILCLCSNPWEYCSSSPPPVVNYSVSVQQVGRGECFNFR